MGRDHSRVPSDRRALSDALVECGACDGGIFRASLGCSETPICAASSPIVVPFLVIIWSTRRAHRTDSFLCGVYLCSCLAPRHVLIYQRRFKFPAALTTDNGPNDGFGDASESCTSAAPGGTHGDELLLVKPGAYYGHANRNRGRSDPRQCAYRWPDAPSTNGYTPPLLSFGTGSFDGIVEVLSNAFPALKHDLLVTRFSAGKGGLDGVVKRIRLSDDGGRAAFAGDVAAVSGVDVTETPHGSYLMPRVQKGELLFVAPAQPPGVDASRPFFTAVKPHRGRAAGGNVVTVGGVHFGDAPTATIGGKACTGVHAVAADGTSFRCTVPPADRAGTFVRLVVATGAGVESGESAGRGDFWYMN